MLAIQEGHYTFPVYIEEDDDIIDIYIGNAKRKKAPCIRITLFRSSYAILQDLIFFPHCSISEKQLQKGDGSVIVMLKAVLKWLIRKYNFIHNIEFTDKSRFNTKDGTTVYLAEKCVLIEGQTWYMKHFGAEPSSGISRAMYNVYKKVHDKNKEEIAKLDKTVWIEDNLEQLYSKFPSINGKRLSGTTWNITRTTVENYNVNPIEVQIGGGPKTCENLKQVCLSRHEFVLPRKVYLLNL